MKVLYFASLREKLGRESEVLTENEIVSINTVAALKTFLMQRGDGWLVLDDQSTRVAVNQKLANDSTELHGGDEIAFFPPVTGG